MSKKSFQDVVKIKRVNKITKTKIPERVEFKNPYLHYEENKNYQNNSRHTLWFVALISVVFLLFSLSFLFSRAKVAVDPKIKDLELNEKLFATKNSSSEGIAFQLIEISGEETKTVQGGELKDVSLKAKGVVSVYNTFSSSPQILSINTRLEGSNGKLYMTDAKITVPGLAKDGTPGHVDVSISAAEAGIEWNSDPLDFKIFGFKGTPKYSKIYARSKTPITGGLKGKFSQVAEKEKVTVVNDLKSALKIKLFKKATDQIPAGFIMFKDAAFINIDDEIVNYIPDGSVTSIIVKGTLSGFIFNEKELTKKIVENNLGKNDDSDIYIPKIRDLSFTLLNKENVPFRDIKSINFTLVGNTKIVWRVNSEDLMGDLLNSNKKDFNNILSKYSNINSADLVLRPAWKNSLPSKKEKIDILINYPQ